MNTRCQPGPRSLTVLVGVLAVSTAACAQDVVNRPDALVSAYHEAGLFDGAVLVARGDSVLYAAGFGQADRARSIPNTADTRFRIASVTKQFTAALILQLVEEGRVELDAPITTYLPNYPQEPGERVTVHHLLSHTSGLAEGRHLRDPGVPLDTFLVRLYGLPLGFEPGTRYEYSNPNYHLLGLIVEAVTGQPYAEALRGRILDPLGMENTGVAYYGEAVDGLAQGYARTPSGHEVESPFLDAPHTYAAGAMYSTVRDLHRWTRALHGGAPFRDVSTRDLMLRPHAEAGRHPSGTYAYGYGIMVLTSPPDSARVYLHDGRHGPFVSDLRYLADGGYTVVALGNADGDETAFTVDVASGLVDLLRGRAVERPTR